MDVANHGPSPCKAPAELLSLSSCLFKSCGRESLRAHCGKFGGPLLGAIRVDDFRFQFYQQPNGWLGEKATTDIT